MESKSAVWAIGLMSGTSADGIDAALIRSDGIDVFDFGPRLTITYTPDFRACLIACFGDRVRPAEEIAAIERKLTDLHARAVRYLLQTAELQARDIAAIGFHGQTIFHAPERRLTRQIGDGARLARATGIDVVNDFRSADVAAGGEGAPLVPIFHQALARDLEKPLAILNIGGVANVTWIGGEGDADLLAFDTGPGNALIDDWAFRHTGCPMDRDGALAAAGIVDRDRLARWLTHPYFARPAPKSLDRGAFSACWPEGLSAADGAATLSAFTIAAIAGARRHFPAPARRWLVAGGGRHNPHLLRGLGEALAAPVDPIDNLGWDGDALEAQAFAYLALRSRLGLPLTYPGTTGVARPLTGGRYHPYAAGDPARS